MAKGPLFLAASLRLTACLLGLALAAPVLGQVTLPPQVTGDVGDFVVVTADTPDPVVKWFVIDKGLKLFPQELQNDTKKAVVIALTPGRYRLLAVSAKDSIPSDYAECVISIGGVIPVPPPGPDPPPPVPPPPDPTPAGKRNLIILRESGNSSPHLAQRLTAIQVRTGQAGEYIKAKGHGANVLDGSDGAGVEWMEHAKGLPLPALLIYEPKAKAILFKGVLPETDQEIVDLLQKHGG